jgi:hypothetical protein
MKEGIFVMEFHQTGSLVEVLKNIIHNLRNEELK